MSKLSLGLNARARLKVLISWNLERMSPSLWRHIQASPGLEPVAPSAAGAFIGPALGLESPSSPRRSIRRVSDTTHSRPPPSPPLAKSSLHDIGAQHSAVIAPLLLPRSANIPICCCRPRAIPSPRGPRGVGVSPNALAPRTSGMTRDASWLSRSRCSGDARQAVTALLGNGMGRRTKV